MSEISENSLGLDARVTFLKADGSEAVIDGDPRWDLGQSPVGNPVAKLTVDRDDPFHATITPLPVPENAEGPAHSAIGTVEADGDLDRGEERLVTASFVVTVRREEAQTAGVELTEITTTPTPNRRKA